MGVYMSKPIRDKVSSDCDNNLLKCGASSMQGWRMSQEDAHNCCLDFDESISLFAVYDGHGGHEVAEYAAKHLPNVIKENAAYKKGDYTTSLIEAFLEFDAMLKTPPVMETLAKIAKCENGAKDGEMDDEEEEEEEAGVQKLREEADMPLSEVIAMYASGGFPKTPKSKLMGGPSPMSPFLRAKPSSSSAGAKDSEVSSSSGPPLLSNGAHGKEEESTEPDSTKSADGEKPGECSSSSGAEVSSSSTNGEIAPSSTSKDEPLSTNGNKESNDEVTASPSKGSSLKSSATKKEKKDRAAKNMRDLTLKILEESFASEEDDSSVDETFEAGDADAWSSDEDAEVNGSKESEEDQGEDNDDDEEEEEGDEEAEESDDDDDEEVDDGQLGMMGMRSEADEPGMDSGCTAVVALVTKDKLYVANAGDSRAVLCRGGKAVDLSVDHKPEDPVELKRIHNAGGRVTNDGRVNGGLNLSRALGDHFYKKSADLDAKEQMITALPDVVEETLDRSVDEFIVIACDGIWNSKSSQQVVDFVRPLVQEGQTLSSICEQLFEECLAPDTSGDGTGCDNMTCVIVQLKPLDTTETKKRPSSPVSDKPSETEEPESKKVRLSSES